MIKVTFVIQHQQEHGVDGVTVDVDKNPEQGGHELEYKVATELICTVHDWASKSEVRSEKESS